MDASTACGQSAEGMHPSAVVRFSTSDYAPRDRLAAWRELYGQTMLKVDIEPVDTESFQTDVRMRKLPGLSVMTGSRSAAVYRRKRNHIDNDDLVISLGLSGPFEVSQAGRAATMSQGDGVMIISAEPGRVTVPANGPWINLCVPSRAIAGYATRYCRPIPANNTALRLLARYVGILEEADTLAVPDLQHHAVTHIHDLIRLALNETANATDIARSRGVRAARLRTIKAYVAGNFWRESLSVATVAARYHLPVRSLQRLFEADGMTFTDFVLNTRLARVHAMLSDARLTNLKISAIAGEAGFGDMSYFNQVFRRRYDETPSDVRGRLHSAVDPILVNAGCRR